MSGQSPQGTRSSPNDQLVTYLLAMVAAPAVLAGAATHFDDARAQAVARLVDHQVLLPTSAAVLLEVPGAGGAGLDLPRLTLLAAVLLVLVAAVVTRTRRWVRARQEIAL